MKTITHESADHVLEEVERIKGYIKNLFKEMAPGKYAAPSREHIVNRLLEMRDEGVLHFPPASRIKLEQSKDNPHEIDITIYSDRLSHENN